MSLRDRSGLPWCVAAGLLICSCLGGGLAAAPQTAPGGKDAKAAGPVQGTISMGDKTYKAEHAVAFEDASRSEKSTVVLISPERIADEKLRASLKKHGNDEDFFLFQTQVKLRFDQDGKLSFLFIWADGTSINVGSSDLDGKIALENGRVSGRAAYKKEKEPGSSFAAHGFDVKFDLPLLVVARDTPAPKAAKSTPVRVKPGRTSPAGAPASEDPPGAANIHDVLLPADARDVEYKQIVQMVKLTSPSPVRAVATHFVDKLRQSGWTSPSPDLITDKSGIINAKKGDASLTIFVKPGDGSGSAVTIMARGLSWNEKKPGETPAAANEVKPVPAGESAEPEEVVELAAEEKSGFPVPEGTSGVGSSSTKYRRSVETQVGAGLKSVVNFYRREARQRGWKESDGTKIEAHQARLSFSGDSGQITIQLRRTGNETTIQLASRDADKAKQDGVAPKPGQSCLMLANAHTAEVVITVNKNEYRLPAGIGAKDPRQSKRFDVLPGKYDVQVKLADGKLQTETLTIGPDESWGVIVAPDAGFFAAQVY